jgi:rare lipoprotein A
MSLFAKLQRKVSPYQYGLIAISAVLLAGSWTPASARLDDAVQLPTQRPYVIDNRQYFPIPNAHGFNQTGTASWYGHRFHGRRTSSGEVYDMHSMTAAHKLLPMNTMLLVENLENNRKTIVRVNDRGPFIRGRIIDLSYRAARRLGIVANGTAKVAITALGEKTARQQGEPPTLVYPNLEQGEFYVQIGSFAQRPNAQRLKSRFTDAGHITFIRTYSGPDNILYRVQVYVGKTLANAKRAEKALLEHGWAGCFIIAR